MADLIYCGTEPVGSVETQALLAGPFAAIWAPPMHRKALPKQGDRLRLLWQAQSQAPVLLGSGHVLPTRDGRTGWTNKTAPGIVGAAKALGYGGPTNMAFLRLSEVLVPADTPTIHGFGKIAVGLTLATQAQADILQGLAPQ